MRRRPQTFQRLAKKYGDVVRWHIGHREIWLVSHPELIAKILRDSYTHFEKDWGPRRGHASFGNGLLTSEGAEHRAQRMDFSRLFARPNLEAKRPIIAAAIDEWSGRQREGAEVDLFREMSFLSSGIASRALFGCTYDPALSHAAISAVGDRFSRAMFPYADRFRRRVDAGAALRTLIAHVRANATGEGLLPAAALPDDQIATFLVAGQETVRIALTWSWLMLSKHPEFRGGDAEGIMLEAMRLHPPQWMIGRRAIAPYPLGDYEIPRGAMVLFSPYIVHRDPRWFAEPERFDPTRWQKPLANRAAYFPFGGGPRRCIGDGFAMVAGTMAFTHLMREWTFECSSHAVRYDARLTLQPARVTARLRRVTSPAAV